MGAASNRRSSPPPSTRRCPSKARAFVSPLGVDHVMLQVVRFADNNGIIVELRAANAGQQAEAGAPVDLRTR